MFFFIDIILVGGVAVSGVKIVRDGRKPLSLKHVLSSQEASLPPSRSRYAQTTSFFGEIAELRQEIQASIKDTLNRADEQYQLFMLQHVDRSLGRPILQDLNGDSPENPIELLDPEEKTTNRYIAITGLSTIIAWTVGQFTLSLLMTIPASLYIIWPIYKTSYQALVIERRLKLEVLWALFGTLALINGYIGAMAFSLMLGFLSNKLILITQERSHKKIIDVFGQRPRTVWVLIDGNEIEVPFEQLKLGDTVIVEAGQTVPVDGIISQGMATIDQHALTGEAHPVEKGMGETVFATTVILGGKIQVQVQKTGPDSVAAQVGQILSNSSGYQTALESKGIEVSDKTVLPRLLCSGLAWPLVGLEGAIAILGCGIGTSIRFASPLAMLNFLNRASHNGILVKDGRSLELLTEIDTIIFDKTGTLTLEQPYVSQIHPLNGITEDDLLRYAATAEHRQTHPIAKAILTAADERELSLLDISHGEIEVGYGTKAILEGKEILVGSHRYMALEGINLSSEIQTLQTQCQVAGHSLVFVALDAHLAGAIELQPTIRPEAQEVIQTLRKRNYTLYIISGDQEEPTRNMAEQFGIDHYYANTLPQHKAVLVEQLQQEGRSVCFIGDGINDSIALKKAKVSISLLGATTVATDTAQIVLMSQSLQQLPELVALAHEFNTNMKRGFALAVFPGIFFISGVFLFHWGIYSSILAYNITLSACIGNAMLPLLGSSDQAEPMIK